MSALAPEKSKLLSKSHIQCSDRERDRQPRLFRCGNLQPPNYRQRKKQSDDDSDGASQTAREIEGVGINAFSAVYFPVPEESDGLTLEYGDEKSGDGP